MYVDDLHTSVTQYVKGSSLAAGSSGRAKSSCQEARRRAPKTHLHKELVKRRRDPAPSSKQAIHKALEALKAAGAEGGNTDSVEALLSRSGELPVPEEWQNRYKQCARLYWDHFYHERTVNFFKDRHYLREEFAELMPEEVLQDPRRWVEALVAAKREVPRCREELLVAMKGCTMVVLEVGCAVGNGIIPLLRANAELFGLACDLSAVAVGFLKEKEEYRCGRCFAFPSDITRGVSEQPSDEHEAIEAIVPPGSVDFTTLLFVLSAIDHTLHRKVIRRLGSCLKPGGMALVRDYGRGDLAQLRFSAENWLGGDLYVRGDGTLALFLTTEALTADFEAEGFEVLECCYRKTVVVNRGTGLHMPRVWVQGKFRRRAL